jgi:hypothetical protein
MRSVYFIQRDENGPIKIGTARKPQSRLAILQTGSDAHLYLLHHIPGWKKTERALHLRFSRYRLTGEWFSPAQEILDFIAGLQSGKVEFPSLEVGMTAYSARDALNDRLRDESRDMIWRLSLPHMPHESRADQLARVARLSGIPPRTIKSLFYLETSDVSACDYLTLSDLVRAQKLNLAG